MKQLAQVHALTDHAHQVHGDWLHFTAVVNRPLHDSKDRELVMAAEGFDPTFYALEPVRVIILQPDGQYRSSWYARELRRRETV